MPIPLRTTALICLSLATLACGEGTPTGDGTRLNATFTAFAVNNASLPRIDSTYANGCERLRLGGRLSLRPDGTFTFDLISIVSLCAGVRTDAQGFIGAGTYQLDGSTLTLTFTTGGEPIVATYQAAEPQPGQFAQSFVFLSIGGDAYEFGESRYP